VVDATCHNLGVPGGQLPKDGHILPQLLLHLQAEAQYNRDVARMGGNADQGPDEDYNAFMSELGMGRPDARPHPGGGNRDARDSAFNRDRPHPGLGMEHSR
jgi:hypothetical protein